jgi:hypothetical protein
MPGSATRSITQSSERALSSPRSSCSSSRWSGAKKNSNCSCGAGPGQYWRRAIGADFRRSRYRQIAAHGCTAGMCRQRAARACVISARRSIPMSYGSDPTDNFRRAASGWRCTPKRGPKSSRSARTKSCENSGRPGNMAGRCACAAVGPCPGDRIPRCGTGLWTGALGGGIATRLALP